MRFDTHLVGSASGYGELAASRGCTAEEREAMCRIDIGQPGGGRGERLEREVVVLCRTLESGRVALTRCVGGPADDAGRRTIQFRTLLMSSQAWTLHMRHALRVVLPADEIWANPAFELGQTLTVPGLNLPPTPATQQAWILGEFMVSRPRPVLLHASEASEAAVLTLLSAASDADAARLSWGLGLGRAVKTLDVATLGAGASVMNVPIEDLNAVNPSAYRRGGSFRIPNLFPEQESAAGQRAREVPDIPPPPRRRRVWLGVAALALVVATSGVWWLAGRMSAPQPAAEVTSGEPPEGVVQVAAPRPLVVPGAEAAEPVMPARPPGPPTADLEPDAGGREPDEPDAPVPGPTGPGPEGAAIVGAVAEAAEEDGGVLTPERASADLDARVAQQADALEALYDDLITHLVMHEPAYRLEDDVVRVRFSVTAVLKAMTPEDGGALDLSSATTGQIPSKVDDLWSIHAARHVLDGMTSLLSENSEAPFATWASLDANEKWAGAARFDDDFEQRREARIRDLRRSERVLRRVGRIVGGLQDARWNVKPHDMRGKLGRVVELLSAVHGLGTEALDRLGTARADIERQLGDPNLPAATRSLLDAKVGRLDATIQQVRGMVGDVESRLDRFSPWPADGPAEAWNFRAEVNMLDRAADGLESFPAPGAEDNP